MKNLLIFFVLFSFALPTQASASACLHPHIAYPKQQASKKVVKQVLKQKMKPRSDDWDSIILIALIAFVVGGGILGLIGWLIFKGSLLLWILGGLFAVLVIMYLI